jgi:hypothetical protein
MVWIDQMVGWYTVESIVSRPVFRDKCGECGLYGDYEHGFLPRMVKAHARKLDLFT